jgi:hypothetical protein
MTGTLLDLLEVVPGRSPFVGPDQAALEALLASFEPPGQPSGEAAPVVPT